jgi:hypothetical protein
LGGKCQRHDGVFDEKLADYVFFPLSRILQKKQRYTDRLSEISIKCLRILLEYGWQKIIALDLAKQLLVLLTFVAGGIPGKEKTTVPEEIVVEAYGALAALFADLSVTPGGTASLVEPGTIPSLGHTVTVILDGIIHGPSAETQIQGLQALDALWHLIKDPSALSSFLPGTISALTKCLTPQTGFRRTRRTLVKALEIMTHVLVSVLSDIQTRRIRSSTKSRDEMPGTASEQNLLTKSWLNATTGQIKLALANVVRLRNHESVEVHKALNRLCITVLDECHDTLSESASMLVETCMALSGVDEGDHLSTRTTTLIDLASIHINLSDLIKNIIYNWMTSLPRVMQANDEKLKLDALGQLSKAHDLIVGLQLESAILEDAFGNSLRDSITVILEPSDHLQGLEESSFDISSQSAVMLASDKALATQFPPIIMAEQSQGKIREKLLSLLSRLGTRQAQLNMASEMLEYAREASGPSLLSAYWLASNISRFAASSNKDLDDFFESSLTLSDEQEYLNQELFSFSQSLLAGSDERTGDWRLQAIALETVADVAQRKGLEFRSELVDTLYPVAQLLGSPNPRLREHAITCLNNFSVSCGYSNASEMIIANADYMVNAISLRLNTFDISPQAPQVLVMMIRLTGPKILLYLDDVVGSIFAALDNFHGYYRLVDVLFSVLSEIVLVGSSSDQLQIEDTPDISHEKKSTPISTIDDILSLIQPRSQVAEDDESHKEFPQKPWKSAKALLDEASAPSPSNEDSEDSEALPATEIIKPPPTKIYTMIQSIARLSQHYLTSPSPVLRSKLLDLIRTSSIALRRDEDSFLPLVNDIWPVLIIKLYDNESYVQIAACQAVSEICRSAGDFLATRVADEWASIIRLGRKVRLEMEQTRKGGAGRGAFTQSSKVWEAVVGLLMAVVGYVRIEDEMFDEVVEVLGDLVWEREVVKRTLDEVNRDAVWLAMQIAGKNKDLETPVIDGYTFLALNNSVIA